MKTMKMSLSFPDRRQNGGVLPDSFFSLLPSFPLRISRDVVVPEPNHYRSVRPSVRCYSQTERRLFRDRASSERRYNAPAWKIAGGRGTDGHPSI